MITVVDNSNLADIMAEAGVVEEEPSGGKAAEKLEAGAKDSKDPKYHKATEPADKDKPDAAAKKDGKAEPEQDDADDVEDEDGTTARQKRELSAKMLKAIGKKHRQVREAEEFASDQIRIRREAEARAADLDRQLKQEQARNQPAAAKADAEPERDDFATDAEFMKASIKWGVDQGIKRQKAEEAATQRQATVQQQFKRAAELVPDFDETVSKQLNYPAEVVAYMRESDMFAELGYHFAKHPAQLAKLVDLPPVRQLVELGKIEARLAPFGSSESSPKDGDKPNGTASKPAPSTVDTGFSPSKARSDAPVIKPLTSGEGTQVEPDVREMNTRQMIERFQKDQKVNLHARKRH